jgi:Asp-tRNA(Asn)/Glu-tRNA(Gln) amidotransferase A subunit family amidase
METFDLEETFISFVEKQIKEFQILGDLTSDDEIPIEKVFYSMSQYYNMALMLNSLYQREKIHLKDLELTYEAWYSDRFAEAKTAVRQQNEGKNVKPALKEYEMHVKEAYREDYFNWQKRLVLAESKCDFFIRMRETLNKYDQILTGLAASMRSELRALSIEDRAKPRDAKTR